MSERPFDIVLWGATGATGRRAGEHLARRCRDSGLRLAIGGRNGAKLARVQKAVSAHGLEIPVLVGDSLDAGFMASLAAKTHVVASTVGPFALYGSPLVAACAQAGTHYCDLTAEPQWMRAMIAAHENTARQTGARLVHACGTDSIPSDLGVQYLQEIALSRFGSPCRRVVNRVVHMKGGFSGGTAASFLNAMRLRETDPEFDRLSRDPYVLCPEDGRTGPDGPDRMMPLEVTWDPVLKAWTKPFFMGPMNAKVVRRSNAIMGYPYGRDFSYRETALTRGGIKGWLAAAGGALLGRGLLVAMAIPVTRRWLQRHVLPKSGEGPDRAVREGGSYQMIFLGQVRDGSFLGLRLTARGDPGVRSTTLMLTEAAICLAQDTDRIRVGGGFWTPAAAMGGLLRDRVVAHAGLSFEEMTDLAAPKSFR